MAVLADFLRFLNIADHRSCLERIANAIQVSIYITSCLLFDLVPYLRELLRLEQTLFLFNL